MIRERRRLPGEESGPRKTTDNGDAQPRAQGGAPYAELVSDHVEVWLRYGE